MSGAERHKQDDRARQNVRLEPEILTAIDVSRRRRPGNISRNTWITEAILEKLQRDNDQDDTTGNGGKSHVQLL